MGLSSLPDPTPQMVQAMGPMVMQSMLNGGKTIGSMVNSVGDTSACVSNCRIACQAGEQGTSSMCSVTGSDIACAGDNIDSMGQGLLGFGDNISIQLGELEEVFGSILPIPFSATNDGILRGKTTFRVLSKQPPENRSTQLRVRPAMTSIEDVVKRGNLSKGTKRMKPQVVTNTPMTIMRRSTDLARSTAPTASRIQVVFTKQQED